MESALENIMRQYCDNFNKVVGKGGFELIHRFDDKRGHFDIWEEIVAEHSEWMKYDYEHFPRGRVWVKNDTATIFLDEKINTRNVVAQIVQTFCLSGDYEIQPI